MTIGEAQEKICPFISNGEKLVKCIAGECIAWKYTKTEFSTEEKVKILLNEEAQDIWNHYIENRKDIEHHYKEELSKLDLLNHLKKGYCLKIGDIEK